jgi:hypothetical protein
VTRAAEQVADFVERFGVPLLRGDPCVISSPVGGEALEALQHGLAIDPKMEDCWDEQLSEAALLADVTPSKLDLEVATLLYATHELFAACHPQAQSFYARTHLFCEAAEQAVMKLPRTYDPSRLLSRHLVVRRAFGTQRTDVHLKWWTGAASFYGREPPTRLTSWPELRRVHVDRQTHPMWKLAMLEGDEESRVARANLMTTMLMLSPLSQLMMLGDPLLKELGFSLMMPLKHKGKRMSALYCLEDRALARGVCDSILERGVDHAGPMLALALLAGVRESNPPIVLRRATELCLHLVLLMALAEGLAPGSESAKPLRDLFDKDPKELNDALRVFWSAVRAGLGLDGRHLELPDDAELPEGSRKVWRRAAERLTHKHFAAIADPLERELSRRLPPVEGAPPETTAAAG